MTRLLALAALLALLAGCKSGPEVVPSCPRHMRATSYRTGVTLYEGEVEYNTFLWTFGQATWQDTRGDRHRADWDSGEVGVLFGPAEGAP